jgi:hypothetical protein
VLSERTAPLWSLMPTDSMAAAKASSAPMSPASDGGAAEAPGTIRPTERTMRPSRSRRKRVSLWKTVTPATICSTRTMRRPLLLLTLSPMKRRALTSASARP